VQPRDEVEGHVDPGRHARGGHDVAVVDETRIAANVHVPP
jgi:hypothetical protein